MGILGTSSWRDDDSGSVKILRSDEVMVTMVSSTHRCHPERLRGWMWTGWSLEMEGYRRLERRSRGEADQLCLSQSSRDETSWRTFPPMARRWSYSIGHAQHCRATAVCSFAVCTLPHHLPWNLESRYRTPNENHRLPINIAPSGLVVDVYRKPRGSAPGKSRTSN